MRHEFLCPEFESKGICGKTRCPYTHKDKLNKKPERKQKLKEEIIQPMSEPVQYSEQNILVQERNRYFIDDHKTEQIGQELSEFGAIKLSRVLNKIEKVKANYKFSTEILTESGDHCAEETNSQGTAASAPKRMDDNCSEHVLDIEHMCVDDKDDDTIQLLIPSRPKLGPLPSYIPIE